MSIGGKAGRDDIPGKQHCDTEERKDAENDWCCPVSAIETPVHNKSLTGIPAPENGRKGEIGRYQTRLRVLEVSATRRG